MNVMERKNVEIVKEFNAYVREHPEFAERIPNNAVIIMQLEGDEEFNQWSHKLAESHYEEGRPIVHIRIKKIKPVRSRIEELEIQQ
jgi:hypothetical protein